MTLRIDTPRSRLVIDEHPDSAFMAIEGGCLFLDPEQCMAVAGELVAIARRKRKRR